MEQIHGHQVVQMMLNSSKGYTRESLLNDIVQTFGADARFYTCSAEDLTPAGLIDFLEAKGKFVSCDDGFRFNQGRMCNH